MGDNRRVNAPFVNQPGSVASPLTARILAAIDAAGGHLSFERFMGLALYEPGLGYYASGTLKFGHDDVRNALERALVPLPGAPVVALVLLQGNGLAVTLEGAVLWWDGRQIAIDAPCSGIRMLWAGAYLMVAASALFRFSTGQTLCAAALTLTTVVAANALRAAALFYLEAGLVPLPAWTHEAAGMAVFLAAGCTIVAGLHRIDRFSRKGAVC